MLIFGLRVSHNTLHAKRSRHAAKTMVDKAQLANPAKDTYKPVTLLVMHDHPRRALARRAQERTRARTRRATTSRTETSCAQTMLSCMRQMQGSRL